MKHIIIVLVYTFQVHSQVIQVWSPFFKRLLQLPMKEKERRRVVIKEDVGDPAVGGLVHFMYHCEVPPDCRKGRKLIDLFRLAHQ